jgi:hypothetical protein
MSKFIDNIPNKKTNYFTPIKDFDNFRDINAMIEGFETIDDDDLEYSSFHSRPSYKEEKNKHINFLPSSLNDKIEALIKKETNPDKPEQYIVLAKNDNDNDKLLMNDETNYYEHPDKTQKKSDDESSKKNTTKMDIYTSVYVGSLTVVALFLLYRFIQKSR